MGRLEPHEDLCAPMSAVSMTTRQSTCWQEGFGRGILGRDQSRVIASGGLKHVHGDDHGPIPAGVCLGAQYSGLASPPRG